jgi:multidrug efflux system outer membrane protein
MKKMATPFGVVSVIAGCTIVGPEYQAPTIALQQQFIGGASTSLWNAAESPWWEQLNDPLLNQLVERGAKQNMDIRAAIARIQTGYAVLGQTGLNAQTSGNVEASAEHKRVNGNENAVYAASADARYVFDLFGGVFRRQQQGLANLDAARYDAGTVRLAYLSDLANSYIQARYFQETAAITRQTVASRRRTLGLVNERFDAGEATQLEREQARALLLSSEAALPSLIANFERQVFHIATLLGEPAGPLLGHMQRGAAQPYPSGGLTGVPADLLRNRPDIRFAERNLAAATAGVGIAEAQLYPSLQIIGSVNAGTVDGWSFGPFLAIPVLNRGVLQNRRRAAESRARESELEWRRVVLVAIEDVQTELSSYRGWRRQIGSLRQAYSASGRVLSLSRNLYSAGTSTLTDVLDAERAHAANRLAIADAVRNLSISWVRIQVATGKGWRATDAISADETAPRAAPRPDPLGLDNAVNVAQR